MTDSLVGREVVLGLRFNPKDLPKLQEHADRMTADGTYPGMATMMRKAAAAAATGEPLIIFTTHPEEARVWAEGFTGYEVEQPVIEEVRL